MEGHENCHFISDPTDNWTVYSRLSISVPVEGIVNAWVPLLLAFSDPHLISEIGISE